MMKKLKDEINSVSHYACLQTSFMFFVKVGHQSLLAKFFIISIHHQILLLTVCMHKFYFKLLQNYQI